MLVKGAAYGLLDICLSFHLLVLTGTSSHQQAYCMHSSYLNGRGLVRCDNLPSVSYFRKSEFVKSNVLSDLGFVNHLKV